MGYSGTYDFIRTCDQIVTAALRKIGKVPLDGTPTATQLSEGMEALNSLVKYLPTEGVFLWTEEECATVLVPSNEVIGTDTENYTCILSHTAAAANHPITGADWPLYWVKGGQAGVAWGSGTGYESSADLTCPTGTLDVLRVWTRDVSGRDLPVSLQDKATFISDVDWIHRTTRPTCACVERKRDSVLIRLKPLIASTSTDTVLHYSRLKALEDFDDGTNYPDFPTRWINPLTYRLADDLADDYHLELQERVYLGVKGEKRTVNAVGHDQHENVDDNFVRGAFDV